MEKEAQIRLIGFKRTLNKLQKEGASLDTPAGSVFIEGADLPGGKGLYGGGSMPAGALLGATAGGVGLLGKSLKSKARLAPLGAILGALAGSPHLLGGLIGSPLTAKVNAGGGVNVQK